MFINKLQMNTPGSQSPSDKSGKLKWDNLSDEDI